MTKRIAIIQGHPDPAGGHLCHALADAYEESACAAGLNVARIDVARIAFAWLRTQQEFESGELPANLVPARDAILAAEHLVIVFPLWLGMMPAMVKVFFEQIMRPGIAFAYRKKAFRGGGMDRPLLERYAAATIVGDTAMPLTQDLGRFASGLTFENLPREAVEIARIGFIDTIATMIAGANDPAPQLLRRGLAPGAGPASLYFSGETASAPEAAWINGTAGHALDYDDVGCRGHVSTVLVPAILAEAETLGLGGRELFAAYVAGYETWAELARRDPGHHHAKGWHPTGIFGAIGAGAACAALRRLDPGQATMAIALSASQAGGIMANFGTMTKPFHAGRVAHAGLVSARLAELGFTASPDALEHKQGFLSAVSPEGRVERDSPTRPGGEWQIVRQGLSIKKYPACYCTHRSLDAMLDLLAKRPLKPAEIGHITVSISQTHSLILRNHAPQTGLEAKFSMEFAMAAAVVSRRASLAEYTDEFVRRPEVQELMRRVSIITNENYDPQVSGASVHDQVVIELVNGERIESEKVRRARGHAELPLGEAELFDKFRTCLDAGGARISPERLFERLRNLENISARELTAIG